MLHSNIPLGEDADNKVHGLRRVDADVKIAHVPEDDRRVEVSEHGARPNTISDIEWERSNKPQEV